MVKCKDCKWWEKLDNLSGECRGNTPLAAVGMSRLNVPESKILIFFPRTTPDLHCRLGEVKEAIIQ
jgi:hypothetical protein